MSMKLDCGIPPEASGLPTITLTVETAKIEGRCRVLEYGDQNVLLKCRRLYIRIFGNALEISSMDAFETNLRGKIEGVTISERREK